MDSRTDRHLVLYDGVCALCNHAVRFLLRFDRRRRLAFAPLQGKTASAVLERHGLAANLGTLVLVRNPGHDRERVSVRSAAALAALVVIGGGWQIFGVLRLVPRPLRDLAYDWIAANRYRWFGRYDSCPQPPEPYRDRFLE